MADDDTAPETGETSETGDMDKRVVALEAGQHDLTEKVDKILGIVSGRGQPDDSKAAPAGGPDIAHEIRAQLDERDRQAKAAADESTIRTDVAALKASVAELSERPPAPMPRRVEHLMGWR